MAATFPTPPSAQPPPDLPSMPEVSDTLSNYLRTFSLWCRRGFSDSLRSTSAGSGVMLQAYDAPAGTTPKIFLVRVDTAGTLSVTPVAIGGGQP